MCWARAATGLQGWLVHQMSIPLAAACASASQTLRAPQMEMVNTSSTSPSKPRSSYVVSAQQPAEVGFMYFCSHVVADLRGCTTICALPAKQLGVALHNVLLCNVCERGLERLAFHFSLHHAAKLPNTTCTQPLQFPDMTPWSQPVSCTARTCGS